MVAWEYCERKDGMNIVNHKDENPLNNYYSNLEWTDYTGNRQHSIKTGSINLNGANTPSHKYNEDFIHEICQHLEKGMTMKEVFNIYHPDEPVKNDKGMYILIQRIRKKQSWNYIVDQYEFDLNKTKTQRKAEGYSKKEIIKYIDDGLSNKEIMNRFGFKKYPKNSR